MSVILHGTALLAWPHAGFNRLAQAEDPQVIQVQLAPPPSSAAWANDGTPTAHPGNGDRAQPSPPQAVPIPNLTPAPLADRSTPPPPPPRSEDGKKDKRSTPPQPKPAPVTQSERDALLSQVLAAWTPPKELDQIKTGTARIAVRVMPNGYLDDIYDARRAYNPASAYDGYARLPPDSLERRTLDSLYRAIRQAQPLRLTPAMQAKTPFTIRLDFKIQDVR